MLLVICLFLGVILITLHLTIDKKARSKNKIYEVILLYLLVTCFSLPGWAAFYMHVFMADKTAEMIGWPAGSPFQFEVGMADLSMGITGLLCIWIRKSFWLATIISAGVFFLGDGIGHIIQASVHHNVAEYNSGPVLYYDLFIPLIALALYFAYRKNDRSSA